MLFKEEREVLDKLLQEWYDAIKRFTDGCDGVFRGKAKQYDRLSPVWKRIRYPHGFVQELRKKTDRLDQLLANYDTDKQSVDWDALSDELMDIVNYARMLGALNDMVLGREHGTFTGLEEQITTGRIDSSETAPAKYQGAP